MDKLLVKFLQANGYFNNATDIRLQLRSHPDFPSLKAITDTLDYFNIENVAASVPKDALKELPKSFLALLNRDENPFIALAIRKRNKIILYAEDTSKETSSYDEFKAAWTGTVVAIEAHEGRRKKITGGNSIILAAILILLIALQAVSFHFTGFLLTVLALAGLFLSRLIVKEEMGIHSKTVARVCGAVSKSGNCAEVITSTTAKLFRIISLSDLCVAFFTGLTLIYTLIGFHYLFAFALFLLSLPVILFSLYQQAIVLKQWCALCLGIIGILILQSGIVFLHSPSFNFSLNYTLKAVFLMGLSYAVWQYIKPVLIRYLKLRNTEESLLQFKRNQEIFTTLLHKKRLNNTNGIKEEHKLSFGAHIPLITIDAVTNPLCGFCTDAFKTYYRLLKNHPDTIKINIIFNVPAEQQEHNATQIAVSVLECYTAAPEKALEALHQWFTNRSVEVWQKQYGIPEHTDKQSMETLTAHRTWCMENGITYTPATVIDGYLYPKEYSTTDLILFIDEMLLEKTNGSSPAS